MDFSLGRGSNELVIDCSSSDLKVAVGNYNSKTGNITIEKMGVVPLEGDAINDGAVADSFGIVMALKHALARLDIRMKSCILTTEGAFVHSRDLELPVVKEDQLKDMVKYEILGQGSNRDMSIDYLVYGTTKDAETNADKIQVRATAIPTDVIKDYREFLKNMDLNPVSLDVNPNAVRKLFEQGIVNGNVNIKQSTILLIELSSKTTTVTVLDKGFPVLSRRLQFGHGNIRQVADSVKKLQSGSQQSSLARRLNITTSESDSGVPIEDIDVWIAKYHIDAISTCFLYGSGAGYKKIDKELARQLGTQVEILKSLSTVNGPKDFVLGQFVNCCGALIRHD